MAEVESPPRKTDVAHALLLRGSLFVHLDPRVEGVDVPAWLRDQPQLVLQVGLDMPIPIPDLHVDQDGVCGTLSFSRDMHRCVMPWRAVFALVGDDGRGMVWPDDLPEEIAAEVAREAARRAPARPLRVPSLEMLPAGDRGQVDDSPRPTLSLVRGRAGGRSASLGEDRASRKAAGAARPPYLRVVK